MTIGIYSITHTPTGREYIGASTAIEKRWINHRSSLNRGVHHAPFLQRCWVKHGEAEFLFTILVVTDPASLRREERRVIRERQPAFNCMTTAEEGPLRHDAATCQKMSEAQLRRRARQREAGTAFLTDEHKAHIAQAATGRQHSLESKEKMSKSAKTRPPVSEETRQKLSEAGKAQKGRTFTEEHRARLSAARRGRTMSEEQKQKIAASLRQAYQEGRR